MISKAVFDEYSRTYRETLRSILKPFKKDDKFFDSIKISCIKKYVIKVNNAYDVLDFGCGVGKLTSSLAKNFQLSHVFGYDISRESLAVAKEENAQINNIHFIDEITEDRKFDYIIAANVFHHIDSRQHIETLCTIKKLLKPKGRIIVFEHNPLNPVTRYIVSICPFDADTKLIWLNSFMKLAGMGKLKVELRNYILFFPWQSNIFRKIEGFLRHVPLGTQYMLTLVHEEIELQ